MRAVVVVPFLNEEPFLERFLASVDRQTVRPEQLLLVDDGSTDRSPEIAGAFAAVREWVTSLRRPVRAPTRDRLALAAELVAFQWGAEHSTPDWDVIAKVDADVEFTPRTFETILDAFARDPGLGICGAFLGVRVDGGPLRRERHRAEHVRGASKFYRRECFEAISPLPPHLGWDDIDELRARMRGWSTRSVDVASGDPEHLRPVSSHDGRLRGWRRRGACAWGYGEHPLHVVAVALQRAGDPPPLLGSLNYAAGWALAGVRRRPRAEPELRAYVHRDQLARLRRRLAGRSAR